MKNRVTPMKSIYVDGNPFNGVHRIITGFQSDVRGVISAIEGEFDSLPEGQPNSFLNPILVNWTGWESFDYVKFEIYSCVNSALTAHKCQSQASDRALVDVSDEASAHSLCSGIL
jgi:hypothetical protein